MFESFNTPLRACVIGSTGGIGRALVDALAASEQVEAVYALSRSGAAHGSAKVRNLTFDFLDELSIQAAAEALREVGPFDLIIVATGLLQGNGIAPEKNMRALDLDAMRKSFEVNTFGPALTAKYFLPLLRRDNKAVFAALSARVGSISDNRLGGWYSYRAAKAALNMMLMTLSIETARPSPIFDTQVAAMAAGFGDSVGYGGLVKGRLGINVDKGARFTDWSRRPLSDKQLAYALADVTHLRDLFPPLVDELEDKGRLSWVMEEMEPQMDEALYAFDPELAWQRLKARNPRKPYLAALRAAAAWREEQAIERNVPRRRVLKDDAIYDLATQKPRTLDALGKLRGIPRGFERSKVAQSLITRMNDALNNIEEYAPQIDKPIAMPPNLGPRVEMLKTLLKLRTEVQGIAPRLVAGARDIDQIAAFGDKADVPALKGWRRTMFGDDALALLRGEIGLRLDGEDVVAERF